MRIEHLNTLCGRGAGDDHFRVRLAGIAVDAADRLYAVGDREVKQFSAEGEYKGRFETPDAGWAITADDRSLWIGMHGMVVQCDLDGKVLQRIADKTRLGMATGLALLGDAVIVADATNRTVHEFGRDGAWRREIGAEANTRGFMLPNGVLDLARDPTSESFVVAHPQKHRVERYDAEGVMAGKFGRFGMTEPGDFGGCCNPTNIAVTRDGDVVVSEKAPPLVKLFSAAGEFLAVAEGGTFDENTKNIDLAIDSRDRLYATDPLRCTIEVFQIVRDEARTP